MVKDKLGKIIEPGNTVATYDGNSVKIATIIRIYSDQYIIIENKDTNFRTTRYRKNVIKLDNV